MKKTRQLKMYLRNVYRQQRKRDAQVGRRKNDLVQALHLQNSLPADKRDSEVIRAAAEGLKEMKQSTRFKHDFPNFPTFYNYVTDPKNELTEADLPSLFVGS
jgi:uncharacterized protein YkwD